MKLLFLVVPFLGLAAAASSPTKTVSADPGKTSTTSCQTVWPSVPASSLYYCSQTTSFPASFTSGYTVQTFPCPTTSVTARSATALNPLETSYISAHAQPAATALYSYYRFAWQGMQYPNSQFMGSPPRIGFGFSGGGFRAMLTAAGVMKAFKREPMEPFDQFQSLLDGSEYISALSGGAWAIGSWVMNGFPSIDQLMATSWALPNGTIMLDMWYNDPQYCYIIQCETARKGPSAPISFADNWHRLIARQILKGVPGSATWSGITSSSAYQKAAFPFPIMVSVGQTIDGDTGFNANMPVYEMTPYEFGSWDPFSTGAFAPMNYLGTYLNAGVSAATCMNGLDNGAFILGSSSLAISDTLETSKTFNFTLAGSTSNIVNPFWGFGSGSGNTAQTLYITDGGSDDQNIPLLPLLQADRNLDTIIAVDASADSKYHWPNGTALNFTNAYALSPQGQKMDIAFPRIATSWAFMSSRPQLFYTPTFFGCDAKDTTSPTGRAPPILIYLPNSPYTAYSNASTYATGLYPWANVQNALVKNGQTLATFGDPYSGLDWGTCLACATADRARARAGLDRTVDCAACFKYYCAETKPPSKVQLIVDGQYQPPPLAGATKGSGTYDYH